MLKSQSDLLSLLRLGIWRNDAVAEHISDVDWAEVFALAHEQAVLGIIADAVGLLPREQQLKMKLLNCLLRIEKQNQRMNNGVIEIFDILKRRNLTPVLMKGQAFACNYPNLLHRQSGDVDIYFKNRADCGIAVSWAKEADAESATYFCNKRERKHYSFRWSGIDIELHYFLCLFESSKLHGRLQEIIDREFSKENHFFVDINGVSIETVPPTLSVLHQIIHITRHLLEAGVGLRQICDLAVFINKNHGLIDGVRLQEYLNELELADIASILGFILHEYIGVEKGIIPFPTSAAGCEFIFNEIFSGGNFGYKKTEYRNSATPFVRKLKSVFYFANRCRLYHHLLPIEAKHYFLNKFILNVKLGL